MIKALGDYIAGRFVRRKRVDHRLSSIDPGDVTQVIGDFGLSNSACDEAVEAADEALSTWSATPVPDRVATMRRMKAQLRNRRTDMAHLLARETGRPLWDTREEVRLVIEQLDGLLRYGLSELQLHEQPPSGYHVRFQPRGVIAILGPHSQPALLMHLDCIAALLAGCTVVCKPSPLTPAIGQMYAELVEEADFPRGVFNLIQGG